MVGMAVPPATDHGLARWLAQRAGRMLVQLLNDRVVTDQQQLRDEADKRSHMLILEGLNRWRPCDVVMSEEGVDPAERLASKRVWIVDPLDGTRHFGKKGRSDWAVHVALWAHGQLVAGAVALPAHDRVIGTDTPPPYPPLRDTGRLRVVVSRSRPPAIVDVIMDCLDGAEIVRLGSAGAKIAAVIDGDADVYIHVGQQREWDSAAPVAVARATGLHVSHIDGSPVLYNQENTIVEDLLVCRKDLAFRLLSALERQRLSQRN